MGAALWYKTAHRGYGPPPGTKFSPAPARAADSLVDGVGVCVHMANGGVWDNYTAARTALTTMGVRRVRDRVIPGNATQRAAWAAFAAAGIDVDAMVCVTSSTAATRDAALADLNAQAVQAGQAHSLEGVNEPNVSGVSTWAAAAAAHQTAIWNATRPGSPYTYLRGLSLVLDPALAKRQGYTALGDMTAVCNRGNIHAYSGGGVPERWYDSVLAPTGVPINSDGYPVWLTETGYHNNIIWPAQSPGSTDTNFGAPYDIAGFYAPRVVLEALQPGRFERVYFYSLADDGGSVAGKEQHFGLYYGDAQYVAAEEALAWSATVSYGAGAVVSRSGSYYRATAASQNQAPPNTTYWQPYSTPTPWTPKPAGTSLGNFLGLLSDPGPAFTPPSLVMDIPGQPTDLQDQLFAKRDGSWWLALWRRTVAYFPASGGGSYASISAITQNVVFDVPRDVTVYRPHLSQAAQSTMTAVTTVPVSVGRETVLLKITPS